MAASLDSFALRQLTQAEAIALAESGWWHDASPAHIAQFQLSQRYLCMDFSAFHAAVEQALGRPVWTYEFAYSDALWAELHQQKAPPPWRELRQQLPQVPLIIATVGETP